MTGLESRERVWLRTKGRHKPIVVNSWCVRQFADAFSWIERAAELRGTSVTDFVVSNLQAAAAETIREFESLSLRDEARKIFVKALLNPPEPNEALKAAVARHKQMGLWLEDQSPKPKFYFDLLGTSHDRAAFSCSVPPLDKYLQTLASQDMKKSLAAVYVLTPDGKTIAGFYTLSAYSVELDKIPGEIAKKLTRMPEVPATLIGRLARSKAFPGQKIGESLLADALKRSLANSKSVASWAVIVDAKYANAVAFYKKYGFIEIPSTPSRLFLPMETIAKLY